MCWKSFNLRTAWSKDNRRLSHTRKSSCLAVFHCCLAVPLPFLSLILPVVVLNRCQGVLGVRGGRTLAIKPSCCITTGAERGGGDGGPELIFHEHNSKIFHMNGAEISPHAFRRNVTTGRTAVFHCPLWLSVSSLHCCTCNHTHTVMSSGPGYTCTPLHQGEKLNSLRSEGVQEEHN